MTMKRVLGLLAVVAAGLLAVGAGKAPAFTGTHDDWNDGLIDHVEFQAEGPWTGTYGALVVEPLDTTKTVVSGKKKSKKAAEDARKLVSDWCRTALKEQMGSASLKVVDRKEEAPGDAKVVILRWRCVEIDPGSRAKRYWVGFGAGRSGVTLAGSLVDGITGRELMTFHHRKESGIGFAGGDYVKFLRDDATETAKDVGKMLRVLFTTT